MSLTAAVLIWAVVVVASMLVVAFLAVRWGRDPFGWLLLTAVIGPLALAGLVGARQSDLRRPAPFEIGEGPGALPPGRILAACDGSDASVRGARLIAETRPRDDVLLLVVLPHEAQQEDTADERRTRVEAMAGPSLEVLRAAGIPARVVTGYGSPGAEIVRCADEERARAIVVGRRGAGLTKALLGSVSDYVVRHAKRPVVVVE